MIFLTQHFVSWHGLEQVLLCYKCVISKVYFLVSSNENTQKINNTYFLIDEQKFLLNLQLAIRCYFHLLYNTITCSALVHFIFNLRCLWARYYSLIFPKFMIFAATY